MKSFARVAGIALVAASTMFVVACSREKGVDTAQEEAATPRPVVSRDAPERLPAVSDAGLPPGVTLPFRHSIRVDRVIRREGRDDARRVDIEYFEGTQESVYEQAIQAVEAAGFELHNQSVTGNGYFRSSFRKPDYGSLVLIVTPDMGPVTPDDPDAIGRVVFDLPPPE